MCFLQDLLHSFCVHVFPISGSEPEVGDCLAHANHVWPVTHMLLETQVLEGMGEEVNHTVDLVLGNDEGEMVGRHNDGYCLGCTKEDLEEARRRRVVYTIIYLSLSQLFHPLL